MKLGFDKLPLKRTAYVALALLIRGLLFREIDVRRFLVEIRSPPIKRRELESRSRWREDFFRGRATLPAAEGG